MDPFSIVVGAVALTETANKLASSLTDRYRAFSSAPKEMIEIAGQITMCAGLVDVFAKSVDGSGQEFPKKFQKDATKLVSQCRQILTDIETMVPHGSKKPDYLQRLKYAFGDKKAIGKHQESLKQVQHMFMFMTTCWMYRLPSLPQQTPRDPNAGPALGAQTQQPAQHPIPIGSLTGTMSHVPIQINMRDPNNPGSQIISYEATLTLKPIPIVATSSKKGETERMRYSEARKDSEFSRERIVIPQSQKIGLENMRRSPYFNPKLLSEKKDRGETRKFRYSETEFELVRKSKTQRGDDRKKAEEKKKEEERLKMKIEKGENKEEEIASREQASEEVDDLMAQWFNDSDSDSDDDLPTPKIPEVSSEPSTSSSNLPRRPSPASPTIVVPPPYSRPLPPPTTSSNLPPRHPPSPTHQAGAFRNPASTSAPSLNYRTVIPPRPTSATPGNPSSLRPSASPKPNIIEVKPRDWDWACDGCNREFQHRHKRYKCEDCENFDLCPNCYGVVWHRHGKMSFAERGEI